MKFLSRLLATGGLVGYIPFAPGTFGSIVGVVAYWLIPASDSVYFLPLVLLFFILGSLAATQVEKLSQIKDNQIIVIDEIIGMWVSLAFFPKELKWLAIGLIIFRLFDIIKLYPARLAERLPDGWGVMMDDVVAGLYAAGTLRLLHLIAT